MKKIYPIFIAFAVSLVLLSCSKNEDNTLVEEDLTPMQLLTSKTWEVYDHTRNGEIYWQTDNNFGGLNFIYQETSEEAGTLVWEFSDTDGTIYSSCSGNYERIDDSNVLNTFTSAECEMGTDAFVLIITPTVEGMLLNGTIQGNSWIFRLR